MLLEHELSRLTFRGFLVAHSADISGLDPISYFILNNSGDLMNGYQISFAADWLSSQARIPNKFRRPLSLLTGISAVAIAETIAPFGTPDVMDIPSGIIGSILYDKVRRTEGVSHRHLRYKH